MDGVTLVLAMSSETVLARSICVECPQIDCYCYGNFRGIREAVKLFLSDSLVSVKVTPWDRMFCQQICF